MIVKVREARRVFSKVYGDEPPWRCFFCTYPIWFLGHGGSALARHHVDGDDTNNVEGNIVPAHQVCHIKYHWQIRKAT